MGISRGRSAWSLVAAFLFPTVLPAQQPVPQPAVTPKGKLVQDVWETAYLDGYRVGYMHLTVEEVTPPSGNKFLRAARDLTVTARKPDGTATTFRAVCRIDTPQEVLYYLHGGILPYVLRELVRKG